MTIIRTAVYSLLIAFCLCGCSVSHGTGKTDKGVNVNERPLPFKIGHTRVFEDGDVKKVRVHAIWEGELTLADRPAMLEAIERIYHISRQDANEKWTGAKTLWVAMRPKDFPQAVALARSDEETAFGLAAEPKAWVVTPFPGELDRQRWRELQPEPFVPGGKNKLFIPSASWELAEPDEPYRIHSVEEQQNDGVLSITATIIAPDKSMQRPQSEAILTKLYHRLRDYLQDMAPSELRKRV